jgi:hypothetical protein
VKQHLPALAAISGWLMILLSVTALFGMAAAVLVTGCALAAFGLLVDS